VSDCPVVNITVVFLTTGEFLEVVPLLRLLDGRRRLSASILVADVDFVARDVARDGHVQRAFGTVGGSYASLGNCARWAKMLGNHRDEAWRRFAVTNPRSTFDIAGVHRQQGCAIHFRDQVEAHELPIAVIHPVSVNFLGILLSR
jgi:hypothetical protein